MALPTFCAQPSFHSDGRSGRPTPQGRASLDPLVLPDAPGLASGGTPPGRVCLSACPLGPGGRFSHRPPPPPPHPHPPPPPHPRPTPTHKKKVLLGTSSVHTHECSHTQGTANVGCRRFLRSCTSVFFFSDARWGCWFSCHRPGRGTGAARLRPWHPSGSPSRGQSCAAPGAPPSERTLEEPGPGEGPAQGHTAGHGHGRSREWKPVHGLPDKRYSPLTSAPKKVV